MMSAGGNACASPTYVVFGLNRALRLVGLKAMPFHRIAAKPVVGSQVTIFQVMLALVGALSVHPQRLVDTV